jgi:hypothetical protein
MMEAYLKCVCHTSFRVSDAKRHPSGMLICPRCGLLHEAPKPVVESEARQRARARRRAEAAQGRLFG